MIAWQVCCPTHPVNQDEWGTKIIRYMERERACSTILLITSA
jgi:hypothetical protein